MNSTIKNVSHCQVCLYPFDSEEGCPRFLPCGHTFCHSCLDRLLWERKKVCPNCKGTFDFISADVIPINCSVKCLSESVNSTKEHGIKLTRKDLEENTYYVTKGDEEEKKYAKVKINEDQITFDEWQDGVEEGSSCIDFFEFIHFRTAVIDTHKFIEEHKTELHNPKLPKDRIKYSEIEVVEREVFLNSFNTYKTRDFVLEFGGLLKTVGCSSVLPAEAFLKMKDLSQEAEDVSTEVVITTIGGSPRAFNFLLLASGIMDESYQGTQIYCLKSSVNGGHENKVGSYFPGVVEGIQDGGIYERKERKRGDVEGRVGNKANGFSSFYVWKKDSIRPSIATFGRVKRGMEAIDQIKYRNAVKECGLLLELR